MKTIILLTDGGKSIIRTQSEGTKTPTLKRKQRCIKYPRSMEESK